MRWWRWWRWSSSGAVASGAAVLWSTSVWLFLVVVRAEVVAVVAVVVVRGGCKRRVHARPTQVPARRPYVLEQALLVDQPQHRVTDAAVHHRPPERPPLPLNFAASTAFLRRRRRRRRRRFIFGIEPDVVVRVVHAGLVRVVVPGSSERSSKYLQGRQRQRQQKQKQPPHELVLAPTTTTTTTAAAAATTTTTTITTTTHSIHS